MTIKGKDLRIGQTIRIGMGIAYTITKIEMEPSNPHARFISCQYLHWPLYIGANADVEVIG